MAKYTPLTRPDPNETGWPGGIPYIIGNEGCERFSYYGMRAILWVYIAGLYINYMGMDPGDAERHGYETYHMFTAGVYALPLIGALIADRLLGKYLTILSLSVVYCLGHLALALFEDPVWQQDVFGEVLVDPVHGLGIGLILIAVGSGGIKPCVSAHVGDQFGKGNWHLLQKVYNAFYFIINFGSFFATLLIPVIRGERHVVDGMVTYDGSVSWAFGVPGILMGLATIAFWMGRKKFVHVPPTHPGVRGILDVLAGSALFLVLAFWMWADLFGFTTWDWQIVFHEGVANVDAEAVVDWSRLWIGQVIALGAFGVLFLARQQVEQDDGFLAVLIYRLTGGRKDAEGKRIPAEERFSKEAVEGATAVLRIMTVFLMVSIFWALFDQHGSTWLKQAQQMDLVFEFGLGGWIATGLILGVVFGAALGLTFAKQAKYVLMILGIMTAIGLAVGLIMHFTESTLTVKPSQVQAANPVLVMILIPLTTFGLYPWMAKIGFEPTPLRRMTIGMFMASLAFVSVALLQASVDSAAESGEKIHVVWQMIPYFIMTLSEVMVSITGLEFGYSQAPKRMKSVIMGFWLLMIALGNKLVAIFAGFEDLELVDFFWVFAGLMAGAALLFGLRASFYKYRDYTQ